MIAEFPSTRSLTVGTFWQAPNDSASAVGDDAKSRGLCRVEGDVIEVDVVGELTQAMARTSSGLLIRQPDEEGFDVHGSIPIPPWKVTLLDCRGGRRESNAFGVFTENDHSHQVMGAASAVVGAHVRASDRFAGFRMRVTGLEEWAQTPGFEQTTTTGETVATALSHTGQPPMTAPFRLFGEAAALEVDTIATVAAIDVHGGQIRRWNRIGLTGLSGWTLEEAMTSFVLPIKTLMTLLTGASARVLTVEVQVGERWCEVFGRHIDGVVSDPVPVASEMLLPATGLTLEQIETWVRVARDLSPVPQVVAAGIAGEFASVGTQALVMATAAESLDRRLRPGVREFEPDVMAEAAAVLDDAAIDERLRKKVVDAVETYMGEPSMPNRLQVLALHVARVAPDCVGKVNRWKRAVTDMRNNGAHGLKGEQPLAPGTVNRPRHDTAVSSNGPDEDADDLARAYTLALSIRWALRIRVLQECGISNQVLGEALAKFSEYAKNRSQWSHCWPGIYADSAASASTLGPA